MARASIRKRLPGHRAEPPAAGRRVELWRPPIVALAAALSVVAAVAEPGEPAGRETRREPRAAAAETARQQARLQKVRQDMDALRQRLAETEARAGSVLDAIDEIDLTVSLLRGESAMLRDELRATAQREATARLDAEVLAGQLATSEEEMRRWLGEVYKVGPVRYVRLLASASSPAQIVAGRRAVEALSLAEGRRIDSYRDERDRFDRALADLAGERLRLADLETQLATKSAELRDSRRRKEAVLSSLKRQRASQRLALGELQDNEREIRSLLENLARPGQGPPVPSTGIARFRGQLAWPARGRLAVPFGNVRHPRFATVVPHPGIEIASDPGQEVRAVFEGRVAFSDWFKGYGEMIVIDHGDGFLSIYGHVQERLAAAGEDVGRGQVIARSGDAGTFDVPGLYFEIRHAGKPEDPVPWLRSAPTRIAEERAKGRSGASPRTAP